jgi:hypothetical protein
MPVKTLSKAPNILIMTENDDEFNSLKSLLKNLLGLNSYTIYNVRLTQLKTVQKVWIDNCYLLVSVEQSDVDESTRILKMDCFEKYLGAGGKILSVPSSDECEKVSIKNLNDNTLAVYDGDYFFEQSYRENYLQTKKSQEFETLIYSFSPNKKYSSNDQADGIHWLTKIYPVTKYLKCFDSTQNNILQQHEGRLFRLFSDILTQKLQLKQVKSHTECLMAKPEPYHIMTKNKVDFFHSLMGKCF